jgi:hypothetical protein
LCVVARHLASGVGQGGKAPPSSATTALQKVSKHPSSPSSACPKSMRAKLVANLSS